MPATQLNGAVGADDTAIVVDDASEFTLEIPFAADLDGEPILVVEGPPTSLTWLVVREAAAPPEALAHGFGVDTDGWGNAEEGYDWRRDSTGGNEEFTSDGLIGYLNFTAANGTGAPYLEIPAAVLDQEAYCDTLLAALPVGDTAEVSVLLREDGSGDHYRMRAIVNTDGTIDARITKIASSVSTNLTVLTSTGLTAAAGATVHIRAQAVDASATTVRMKVWLDDNVEPSSWLLSTTDSEASLQVAGHAGYRATVGASLTNLDYLLAVMRWQLQAPAHGTTHADNAPVTAIDPWPHAVNADPAGALLPGLVVGSGAPTAIAPEGATYFDYTNLALYVRARGVWRESGAFT